MKGIILAGGKGTRLYPLTIGVSKQLLPVYDKPMIYYPLSMLMLAGIQDILIISTPDDLPSFKRLLGDGNQLGLNFSYAPQAVPRGLADALIIGNEFIGKDNVCLILGDNIFYGNGMSDILLHGSHIKNGAMVLAYPVKDPERYGIIEFDDQYNAVSIEEKPSRPRSNYAVPGIYFYDNSVVQLVASLPPSARGEIEITDLNRIYLERGLLQAMPMGRGIAWLDAGTHESLHQASSFVQAIEERQGLMIACIEEIAYMSGFITLDQFETLADEMTNNNYGQYLRMCVNKLKSRNV